MKQGMDEGLIYEILSVVEEIPEGKVATYGQIARLIGRGEKCKAGRKSAWHGIVLWELSMSPSNQTMRGVWHQAGGSSGFCWTMRMFHLKMRTTWT